MASWVSGGESVLGRVLTRHRAILQNGDWDWGEAIVEGVHCFVSVLVDVGALVV